MQNRIKSNSEFDENGNCPKICVETWITQRPLFLVENIQERLAQITTI